MTDTLHTVAVNGVTLHYAVAGQGRPVILVHGNGESHAMFHREMAQLAAAGYWVYAPDSRGHGANDPLAEYHYADMAEDMYHFIRALGLEKPCFYGFSDGGIVGLLLALRHPDALSALAVSGANLTPEGVQPDFLAEIRAARRRGQKVYVETCPQYLCLDDSVYDKEDWLESAKYVCSPPIRKKADQDALWRALRTGEVQTISTDHCSFTTQQKLAGRDDFTAIPGGIPGVETRGELIYTYGVAAGRMTLPGMVRALSENPARLYGMFPRKGVIAPGADADIVVYDPAADHVLHAADMVSRCDYSPYEGVATKGSIAQVWLRGTLAVDHGALQPTRGQYIRRGKCAL